MILFSALTMAVSLMAVSLRTRRNCGYQFVEEPPNELKCVICLSVARQPQQHGECGRLFCMSCLIQHIQSSAKCPNCGLQLDTFKDRKSEQEITELKVKCDNLENGCQWTGELGSLNTHTRSCGYFTVSCPNHCEEPKLLHKDVATHQEICPARAYECPHCYIMGPYQELTTSHLNVCPKAEVKCPYPDCDEMVQRCLLDAHKATCQNMLFPCKYACFGCLAQLKQADLQQHEEDDQLHLQIFKEKVLELTEILKTRERLFGEHIEQVRKEISIFKRQLPAMMKKSRPTVFKFRGFDTHKQQNKIFKTTPFYLETGYKFQAVILANGRGKGRDTHISLYMYLTEGCNDHLLSWPFIGDIKIELLNQLRDSDHILNIVRFMGDEDISGRVFNRSRQLTGWGKEQFVSNKELANVSSKRRYLVGDTLYFRVSSLQCYVATAS